jgi:hypothetical protein
VLDYTAEDVLTSGGKITAWVSQVAGAPNLVQANAANQADYIAAGLGGHPSGHFISPDYYLVDGGLTFAGTAWSICTVLSDQDASAAGQYLSASASGWLHMLVDDAVGTRRAYYTTGGGYIVVTPRGADTSEIVAVNGTAATIYRGGLSVASGACDALGHSGAYAVGSRLTGVGAVFSLRISRYTLLGRTAAAVDVAKWAAWSGKYGV